jgi:hypothetical protein
VSQTFASLARADLVREAGRSSGGRGPTATLYEPNPAAGFVVALDVGHLVVRAAVADMTGEAIAQRDERARSTTAGSLIAQLGAQARQVAADGGVEWGRVVFTCVGSPGVLQPGVDHLRLAPNLPGWERQGVVDAVRREIGTPIAFENDVNLATLGEQRDGLGKEVPNYVYLHVGTGVGMGPCSTDSLTASSGAAGEVGYLLPAVRPRVGDPATRARAGPRGDRGHRTGQTSTHPDAPTRRGSSARLADSDAAAIGGLPRRTIALAARWSLTSIELVILAAASCQRLSWSR